MLRSIGEPSSSSLAQTSLAQTSLFLRAFSSYNFSIAWDKIDVKFLRSQGPGGQNVNKVNTKVEMRFNVYEADWMPSEVRFCDSHQTF